MWGRLLRGAQGESSGAMPSPSAVTRTDLDGHAHLGWHASGGAVGFQQIPGGSFSRTPQAWSAQSTTRLIVGVDGGAGRSTSLNLSVGGWVN